MKRDRKEIALSYFVYALLVIFYVFLTAFILFETMGVLFPMLGYLDYLLPAFGLLFVSAGGHDLSNLKIDIDHQRKRRGTLTDEELAAKIKTNELNRIKSP